MADDELVVTLRAEGKGPPAFVRFRRALKLLLRVCGLRCVDVQQKPQAEKGADLAK